MVDAPSCTPDKICSGSRSGTHVARTIRHGDTTYELFVGPCHCGDRTLYRLMRSSGASLSVYQISPEDCEDLDQYVADLHESFAVDVETRLFRLREVVADFNSRGLFEAEGMDVFHVRLIDKARLLLSRLAKNGQLQNLLGQPDNADNDLVAAFLLGCLATDNFWIETHQEAVFEGYAHIEGREAGRPLAQAARLRQGKRSRKAVVAAALKLYDQDPLLRRNDVRTATLIANMKLETLRKRDGTYLGCEAIIKHLRAARQIPGTLGNPQ